ncbi:MAG: GGDEF domain-containing protein [Lachnospiraceae bacterium]|nr:GGDEF domain-containing protein [Lachnospiraceae bacterium]
MGEESKTTNFEQDEMTFTRLAVSLTGDYESVYCVDLENDHYRQYRSTGADEGLTILSSGDDFFADCQRDIKTMIVPEDQEKFFSNFKKDVFLQAVQDHVSLTLNYRLLVDCKPTHYRLKSIRGRGDNEKFLFIGVRNVDEEVRKEREIIEESEVYSQIANAMLSRYEVLYYVDIVTNKYTEYSTSSRYATLNMDQGGRSDDFFVDCQKNILHNIHTEDIPMLSNEMQKGKLLYELDKSPTYSLNYRLLLDGQPEYVNMRAVRPKNDDRHIIIGVTNINDAVMRERAYKEAMILATRDPLTGVKNKRAYMEAEKKIDLSIGQEEEVAFAVTVCDINDLKQVNDEKGHLAGDEYIKAACSLICNIFKHSPVFRVGGDEFAVILQGEDYNNYVQLFEQLRTEVQQNKEEDGIVLASGIAIYDPTIDLTVADVFSRADKIMYKNKKLLKTVL